MKRIFIVIAFLAAVALPLQAQIWNYDVMLAHVACGGGYTSYLNISDPIGGVARDVQVYFFGDAGQPMQLSVDGAAPVSSFTFTLGRWEERSFVLTAPELRVGWIKIVVDRATKVNASLRFAYGGPGGEVMDVVGILPSEADSFWSLTADLRTPNDYIGIAVVNPQSHEVEVEFELWRGENRVAGTATVKRTLAPNGHLAIFLHELYPGTVVSGPVTLTIMGATIAAVALRGDGIQYSSLPVLGEVEMWEYSVTETSGEVVMSGQWCWRFDNSHYYAGVGSDGNTRWGMIGSWNGSLYSIQHLYRMPDGNVAVCQFIGSRAAEGSDTVIEGKYSEVRQDGTVNRTLNFRAVLVK
jgi:hypothetical protein